MSAHTSIAIRLIHIKNGSSRGIILTQQVARWSADRIISGRKKIKLREVNQLIDVLTWFKRQVTEDDRDRIRKLRHLKKEAVG